MFYRIIGINKSKMYNVHATVLPRGTLKLHRVGMKRNKTLDGIRYHGTIHHSSKVHHPAHDDEQQQQAAVLQMQQQQHSSNTQSSSSRF